MSEKTLNPSRTIWFSSGHDPIRVDVCSPALMLGSEIARTLAQFEDLFRNRWPLKHGRARISVGDNTFVVTAPQELSPEQIGHALEDVKVFLKRFPEKVEKSKIYEECIE